MMGASAAASPLGSETWWGSATMVVWRTDMASVSPLRSTTEPRRAGTVTVCRSWAWPTAAYRPAEMPWTYIRRATTATTTRAITRNITAMRRPCVVAGRLGGRACRMDRIPDPAPFGGAPRAPPFEPADRPDWPFDWVGLPVRPFLAAGRSLGPTSRAVGP